MRFPCILLLACTSCAATQQDSFEWNPEEPERKSSIQGFMGVMELDDQRYDLPPGLGEYADSEIGTMPALGFAVQRKVAGERLQFGIEGGVTVGFERDTAAFNVGNSVIIVGNNNLILGDAFLGMYAALLLGDGARIYAGAGPLLQYADVELEFDDGGSNSRLDQSGFGWGAYGRVGIEFDFGGGQRIGFFMRRLESSVDIGDDLGETDFKATQAFFTLSQMF